MMLANIGVTDAASRVDSNEPLALCLFVALLRKFTGNSRYVIQAGSLEPGTSNGLPSIRKYEFTVEPRTTIRTLYEQSGNLLLPNLFAGKSHHTPRILRYEDDARGPLEMIIQGTNDANTASDFAIHGSLSWSFAENRTQHYLYALWSALREAPDSLVDEISILSSEEEAYLVRELSHSELRPDLIQNELLHQIFEHQAKVRPQNVALVDGAQSISFQELNARANQLAHFLRVRGIGRGSFVVIQLSRGTWPYVALLAILKSGAAYVPIDPNCPRARLEYVLNDCNAALLITDSMSASDERPHSCETFVIDQHAEELQQLPQEFANNRKDSATTASDPCYVIYTSGSTGKPKGVEVSHRSACHLVRAESAMFAVTADDRVFQGLSLAFDAAVEEIWLAWCAGATLVVGAKSTVISGTELARVLAEEQVTVLSTVPTLLSLVEDELPTVRLLILGGEACPQQLAARFCRHDRRVVNTYGPTEATVIATAGDLHPQRAVTLGRPIPNTYVYILDSRLRPVAMGASGEICIAGVGLANGYRHLPQLTAERFVPNPYGDIDGSERLYRTGDLARYTPTGEIEYLGRLDAQVKIRGHRIELAEIESALLSASSVAAAVATVLHDASGFEQLVAYVIPTDGSLVHEQELRTMLRDRLPAYMVPSVIETLFELPTLPSGKVDRSRLPAPVSRIRSTVPTQDVGMNEDERTIAHVWNELFSTPISCNSHFFNDLGGHSLLAAQCVSRLRMHPSMAWISILDLYRNPTIRELANHVRTRTAQATLKPKVQPQFVSRLRYGVCAFGQFLSLYAVFGLYSLQWLAPYLAYTMVHTSAQSDPLALLAAVSVMISLPPIMLANAVVLKWLIIGRYKPGKYPLWSGYFFRWWLVNRILAITPIDMLEGTPLLGIYYRLMGAHIGRDVHIESSCAQAFDLLHIGDATSINSDADLTGCVIQDNYLHIGSIRVGSHCTIGPRSLLSPNSAMEDRASLEALSLLPAETTIAAGETWSGSPAAPVPSSRATGESEPKAKTLATKLGISIAYGIAALVVPIVFVASIFPGIVFINHLNGVTDMLLHAPLVALTFVLTLSLQILLAKWIVLGRVRAGMYQLYGWFHFRYWIFNAVMDLSEDFLGGMYSTLYLNPWYRMLGAKIGKHAEMSTLTSASPDLLSIEEGAFLADYSLVGAARISHGQIELQSTRVGQRTFIGNSAVVPGGAKIGNDCLLGVLSSAPHHARNRVEDGTDWLGSPSFRLPRRAITTAFTDEQTYQPSKRLIAERLLFDGVRVLLPSTCIVAVSTLLLMTMLTWSRSHSILSSIAMFPLFYGAYSAAAALLVVGLKWCLIGRFRPSEWPLWCRFVWRNELVTAMHENLAEPLFNCLLEGTPYAAWFYRLLGAKIGQRVYIGTSCFTEYDLVHIGDNVCLNDDCTLQTHLFEDRVLKMSKINIGPRCTVGPNSVVLYDTCMQPESTLGGLSLLMKGETLPEGTYWEGSPARSTSRSRSDAPPHIASQAFHSSEHSRSSTSMDFLTSSHQSLSV